MDEFTYWNEAKHARGNRERAEHFVELFQPISSEYGSLDSMSIVDVSVSCTSSDPPTVLGRRHPSSTRVFI